MSLEARNQGVWQDLDLSGGGSHTTGWTVPPELPERTRAMVGAAQQELDRGGDTAAARDAGQRREILSLLPSSTLLTVPLLAKSNDDTSRHRGQGSAPRDTGVSRKGQRMDLTANRPTTGA